MLEVEARIKMKKILLVEDDQFKAKAILALIGQDFSGTIIEHAKSLSSGYKMLEGGGFDLLLLDMSLPTFDVGPNDSGGEPLGFGGLKLLDLLSESSLLLPTIVVTQFEQFGENEKAINLESLVMDLSKSFSDSFVGLVYYNSAKLDWKAKLVQLIKSRGLL